MHGVRIIAIFIFVYFPIDALTMPFGEIVRVSNLKENQITGFGIVVGLPQTGDRRSPYSEDAMRRFLQNSGMDVNDKSLSSKNIASVMVMARVRPLARKGDLLDIWISSIGDAKSLSGGYLLQTPLKGGDGNIYAVAQTPISAASEKLNDGKNTVYITGGAIMEKEILSGIFADQKVRFSLRNFDFNTAKNSVEAINKKYKDSAKINDNAEIEVTIPQKTDAYQFLAEILRVNVNVYTTNRVVIDSSSGMIVMGGDVGISSVGVTMDGLVVSVQSEKKNTIEKPDEKERSGSVYIKETTKVSELVGHLNKLGLSSRDIIHILKGIDKAGALHGELIIL